MKTQYAAVLAVSLLVHPGVSAGQSATAPPLTYQLNVRPALGQPDVLGLDYRARYDLDKSLPAGDVQGNSVNGFFSVQGFQAMGQVPDGVNSTIAEVAVEGQYYRSGAEPLPASVQARWLELLDRADSTLTRAEIAERRGFVARRLKNRRYFAYDLHYRFESGQSSRTQQNVYGGSISGEIPALQNLLDAFPRASRSVGDTFKPQAVRGYAALERVLDAVVDLSDTTKKVALTRVRGEAAWSTLVLDGLVLRARWLGDVAVAAPKAYVELRGRTHSYFEASLVVPVKSGKSGLLVTYIDGRIPPSYEQVTGGRVGLSFALE